MTGYDPGNQVGGVRASAQRLTLLFVFGPADGFILTATIAWNYPTTEKYHVEIKKQIEKSRVG